MDRIIGEILAGLADAQVEEANVFERASLVLSRGAGLAYRFRKPGPRLVPPRLGSAMELAMLAHSSDPGEASLGVAAINSLIEPAGAVPCAGGGADLLLEWGRGRDVALVGHFAFTEELRREARRLWVLELEPREGDLPADQAGLYIPQAEVVAITGTTLINHTLEGLLELARGKRVMILGPSTIMSPVLFDHGVEAICGSIIKDYGRVKGSLAQGKGLRSLEGTQKLILTRPEQDGVQSDGVAIIR